MSVGLRIIFLECPLLSASAEVDTVNVRDVRSYPVELKRCPSDPGPAKFCTIITDGALRCFVCTDRIPQRVARNHSNLEDQHQETDAWQGTLLIGTRKLYKFPDSRSGRGIHKGSAEDLDRSKNIVEARRKLRRVDAVPLLPSAHQLGGTGSCSWLAQKIMRVN